MEPCEKQPAMHMNVDGCPVTVYFLPRRDSSALEDIKKMILSGLSKAKK